MKTHEKIQVIECDQNLKVVEFEYNSMNKEKEKKKKKKNDHVLLVVEKNKNKKRKHKKKQMDNVVVAGNKETKQELHKDTSDCKVLKSILRDSVANSSEHLVPQRKTKKVRFSDVVEVFPLYDSSVGCSKNKGGLVQGKRFTKDEDKLIRKVVLNYIEANQIGEEGLDMILHWKSHPHLEHCWEEIGAALPWRSYVSVYKRFQVLYEKGEGNWRSYKKNGPKRKRKWSQDEYQALFEEKMSNAGVLMDNVSLEAISKKIGTRYSASCWKKLYNQLTSPMVADGKWADVDDHRLLMALVDRDASCEDEVNWDNLIEHRSGDLCRKRWLQMVRHIDDHRNKSFFEQVEVLSKSYYP